MADLFGTYSKRIKITIDHTEIDSDLTWFPVTVFLDSGQGEEVFTEFDADEDFDRIAFTTSDGSTQLYADCELFDDSESKAIYHVSKTGWTVSSSTDTDIYCYSKDTDILTENGWKNIAEFVERKSNIKIATLNPVTNKVEYHYPTRLFKKKADKLFYQSGKNIDFLVTPNHRVWVQPFKREGTKANTTEEWRLQRADEIGRKVRYRRDFPYDNPDKEIFTIPAYKKEYPTKECEQVFFGGKKGKKSAHINNITREEKSYPMDDFLKVFGIWIAEGSLRKNGTIAISQHQKDKALVIKQWVENLGYKNVLYTGSDILFYDVQFNSWLKQFGHSYDKWIPKELKNLSKRQSKILLDALIFGDGSRFSSKTGSYYATVSKQLADDVQELAIKSGFVTTLSRRIDGIYIVNISENTKLRTVAPNHRVDKRQYVDYNDYVYCVEVPNHIVYARRNGKACWNGNCYYDNTAGHNTTYISKSGGTAAQSVWDSNFKAVYHMNDPDPTGTDELDDDFEDNNLTEYTAGSHWATASDQAYAGTYSAKASGGTDSWSDRQLQFTLSESAKYIKYDFYWRCNDATGGKNYRIITNPLHLLEGGNIANTNFSYFTSSGSNSSLPTTTSFVADTWYHIEVYHDTVNDFAMYWIDGNYKGKATDIETSDAITTVKFGNGEAGEDSWFDDITVTVYDTPLYGIVDATSNSNHGDKKTLNEPAEATGKVGQGQDFDGTNDIIDIDNSATLDTGSYNTTELLFKTSTENQNGKSMIARDATGYVYKYMLYFTANSGDISYYVRTSSGVSSATNNEIDNYYADGTWRHIAGVFNNSLASERLKLYEDGIVVGTNNGYNEDISTGSEGIRFGHWDSSGYFGGTIDEVHVSSTARSTAWIAATYDSLWDNLLTYGSEETSGTTHSVSGSSDSVLSTSSSINITWDLSGSTDSVLSTSAKLNVIFGITGSSDNVLTTSSTIDLGVIEKLTGNSNSILTTSALLKAIYSLSGSSNSTLTTSAIIGAIRGLSGSSDSVLETLATLGLDRIKFTGSSDSVLSTLSTLNTILSLSGNSDNTLSTSAVLNLIYSLSGNSVSSLNTSALLNVIFSLSGSSDSVLDTIATELIVAAVQKLTGSADSTISTLADLGIIKSFGGSADAVLDTIGIIEKYKKLLGTSSSTIATSATINALHRLLGNAQSSVDTSGNINLTWSLSGTSNSIITTLGVLDLGVIEGLSGTVTCVINTSGVLTRIRVWFPVDDVGGSLTNVDDTDGSWVQVSDTDGNWTQVTRPRW